MQGDLKQIKKRTVRLRGSPAAWAELRASAQRRLRLSPRLRTSALLGSVAFHLALGRSLLPGLPSGSGPTAPTRNPPPVEILPASVYTALDPYPEIATPDPHSMDAAPVPPLPLPDDLCGIPSVPVLPAPPLRWTDHDLEVQVFPAGSAPVETAALSAYWTQVRAAIAAQIRYPDSAREQRLAGTVRLELELDEDGALVGLTAAGDAPDLLIRAALFAARAAAPFGAVPPDDARRAQIPIRFLESANPPPSEIVLKTGP